MKINFIILVFLSSLSIPAVTLANEKNILFHFNGYIKHTQTTSFKNSIESLTNLNLLNNRLNLKNDFSNHFSLRIEGRNRVFYGEETTIPPGFGKYLSQDNGYIKLTKLWVNKNTVNVISNCDRALLNYTSEKLIVITGRQRINWGINNIWNPNDIFNAYNFLDFDYEERPGSDAIRIQYFPKYLNAAEFVYKPSKTNKEQIAAALYKFNVWKYDVQFLGGIYNTEITLGTGWAGNIKDAGFKGELMYFEKEKDFTASLFFDYTLSHSWYISGSMLYVKNPSQTDLSETGLQSSLSAKNLMPYRWSFYGSANKAISPILSANLAIIYSPTNDNTVIFPSVNYNISETFDLDLIAQSFFSRKTDGAFNTSANSIYLRIRWSF
jgi:hypothetical protein